MDKHGGNRLLVSAVTAKVVPRFFEAPKRVSILASNVHVKLQERRANPCGGSHEKETEKQRHVDTYRGHPVTGSVTYS